MTLEDEFIGRTALVTGGGQGIGRAVCQELARRGADITFCYRKNSEAAQSAVQGIEKLGRRALSIQCDLGDPDAVTAMVEQARSSLGPITLLVNNAAYTHLIDFDDLTFEQWKRFTRTNVDAPFLTTKAVRSDMIEAGGGAIVNVSSLSATSPQPNMVGYSSSKGALNSFTKASAMAMVNDNIRVNSVVPGLILTERAETVSPEMLKAFAKSIPMKRGGTSVEVADAVAYLLSDSATYITGQELVVAGGQQ